MAICIKWPHRHIHILPLVALYTRKCEMVICFSITCVTYLPWIYFVIRMDSLAVGKMSHQTVTATVINASHDSHALCSMIFLSYNCSYTTYTLLLFPFNLPFSNYYLPLFYNWTLAVSINSKLFIPICFWIVLFKARAIRQTSSLICHWYLGTPCWLGNIWYIFVIFNTIIVGKYELPMFIPLWSTDINQRSIFHTQIHVHLLFNTNMQ